MDAYAFNSPLIFDPWFVSAQKADRDHVIAFVAIMSMISTSLCLAPYSHDIISLSQFFH